MSTRPVGGSSAVSSHLRSAPEISNGNDVSTSKKRKTATNSKDSAVGGTRSESVGSNMDSQRTISSSDHTESTKEGRSSTDLKNEERSDDGSSPAKRSFKAPLMSDLVGSSLKLSIDTSSVVHASAPAFPVANFATIQSQGMTAGANFQTYPQGQSVQPVGTVGALPQNGYVYPSNALPFSASISSAPGQNHGPYFVSTAGGPLVYHSGHGAAPVAGGLAASAGGSSSVTAAPQHYAFPHPQGPYVSVPAASMPQGPPKFIRDSNGVIYQAISTSNGVPLANVGGGIIHTSYPPPPSSAVAAAPGYSYPLPVGQSATQQGLEGKNGSATAAPPATFYSGSAGQLHHSLNTHAAVTPAGVAEGMHGMKPASTSELLGAAAYPKGYVVPVVTTTYVKDANGIVSPRNFVVDANSEPYFVKDENGNITPRGLPLGGQMILNNNNNLVVPKPYGAPDTSSASHYSGVSHPPLATAQVYHIPGQGEYKSVAFAPTTHMSSAASAESTYRSFKQQDSAFTPRSYIRTIADLAGDIVPVAKPNGAGVTSSNGLGSSGSVGSSSTTGGGSNAGSSFDLAGDMSPRSAAYALVSFGQMQFAPQPTSPVMDGSSAGVYTGSSVASEVTFKSDPGYPVSNSSSGVYTQTGNRVSSSSVSTAPISAAAAAAASSSYQNIMYNQYCEEIVLPKCKESGCNVKVEASNMQYCLDHRPSRRCKAEGCTKCAQGATDFCISHGGGRRCTFPGCTKGARDKMFCAGHGGGRRCTQAGCTKSAVGKSDHCTAHGGGKRCGYPGCDKSSQSTTKFCVKHGGGKCCARANCTKVARGKTDYCASHGGGIRCVSGGCLKLAIGPQKLCRLHTVQMKRTNAPLYTPAQLAQMQQHQLAFRHQQGFIDGYLPVAQPVTNEQIPQYEARLLDDGENEDEDGGEGDEEQEEDEED